MLFCALSIHSDQLEKVKKKIVVLLHDYLCLSWLLSLTKYNCFLPSLKQLIASSSDKSMYQKDLYDSTPFKLKPSKVN